MILNHSIVNYPFILCFAPIMTYKYEFAITIYLQDEFGNP